MKINDVNWSNCLTHTFLNITLINMLFSSFLFFGLSCSQNKTKSHEKITYAMPITIAAIPSYVALEKRFWEEEGLTVEAKMFSSGRLALDALLSKDAQVMSVSETPLVHTIMKGNSIFIVATVTQHQEVKLIARTDHGIKTADDLRGKKIATLPGTNSDYFMYEYFKKYNISLNDVQIINLQPADMVTALISGDIDAYFAWEPHVYYAKNKMPENTIVFKPGDLYHGRHCIAMNQDYVRANPFVVEKLIRGLIRAEQYVDEQPDSAMLITAKITGMPTDALKSIWSEYKTSVLLDTTIVQLMIKEGEWVKSIDKSSTGVTNFNNYIYKDALFKVRPSSVIPKP